jgi:hypothetical protein
MFRHVVLFRWTPDTSAETVAEITKGLTACAAALEVTRSYTCGPDVGADASPTPAQDRFDYAVVGDFDDRAGWRLYNEDPEHNRLRAELIGPHIAERVTVQFEY